MIELDIWRAANLLVKQYDGEAVSIAVKRADALLAQGDSEGCGLWVKIARATTDLERKAPARGESH